MTLYVLGAAVLFVIFCGLVMRFVNWIGRRMAERRYARATVAERFGPVAKSAPVTTAMPLASITVAPPAAPKSAPAKVVAVSPNTAALAIAVVTQQAPLVSADSPRPTFAKPATFAKPDVRATLAPLPPAAATPPPAKPVAHHPIAPGPIAPEKSTAAKATASMPTASAQRPSRIRSATRLAGHVKTDPVLISKAGHVRKIAGAKAATEFAKPPAQPKPKKFASKKRRTFVPYQNTLADTYARVSALPVTSAWMSRLDLIPGETGSAFAEFPSYRRQK